MACSWSDLRLLAVSAALLAVLGSTGCAGSLVHGGKDAEGDTGRQGTDMLVLAPDTDPWGGTVLRVGDYSLLAAALHRDNQMGLWRIGPDRQAARIGGELHVGYHPDSVAVWDERSVVLAVEGARRLQHWDVVAEPPVMLAEIRTPVGIRDLVVADVDGDGHRDLVLGAYAGRANIVLWGKGGFEFEEPQFIPTFPSAWHPVVVDWDGDGRLDLIWASLDTKEVLLVQNIGQRQFSLQRLLQVQGFNPRHVAVGDVSGNGRDDLVVAVELGPAEVILRGPGEEYEARLIPNVVDFSEGYPEGHDPALVDSYFSAAIMRDGTIVLGEYKAVILVRFDGDKLDKRWLPAGVLPSPIELFDLDGDGIEDLVVYNSGGGGVTVHFGPLWDNASPIDALHRLRAPTS